MTATEDTLDHSSLICLVSLFFNITFITVTVFDKWYSIHPLCVSACFLVLFENSRHHPRTSSRALTLFCLCSYILSVFTWIICSMQFATLLRQGPLTIHPKVKGISAKHGLTSYFIPSLNVHATNLGAQLLLRSLSFFAMFPPWFNHSHTVTAPAQICCAWLCDWQLWAGSEPFLSWWGVQENELEVWGGGMGGICMCDIDVIKN